MIRVPVMFVVEVGSVVTTVDFFARPDLFVGLVALWLWATVLFANFAEAVAEGRGKAQADTLRQARKDTVARRLSADGSIEKIPSAQLKAGDRCVVAANQVIPGDGDVIAGMDRMVQRNVLAMSGRAVEAAGDCSTLLLDKTGTITCGNRMAAGLIPVRGVTDRELAEAALLSSVADETPEGRSIVGFAQERLPQMTPDLTDADLVPFTAQTRMSGIDLPPDG
ncbi:MAG TPA: hypothetical protein VGD91_00765, partial [Trebonia sp.]